MRFLGDAEQVGATPHVLVHGAGLRSSELVLAVEPHSPTPAEYSASTVAEIALALVRDPAWPPPDVEGVAASWFDGDGLLAAWTLLNPTRALDLRERVVAAARAARFHVSYDMESAAFVCTVNAYRDPAESPAAARIADLDGPALDTALYEEMLPIVERLLANPREFDLCWIGEYSDIIQSRALADSGAVEVQQFPELDLALIETPLSLHPLVHYTLTEGCSRLLTVRSENTYSLEYRLESWTEPRRQGYQPRVSLAQLATRLSMFERYAGSWRAEPVEWPHPRIFFDDGSGRPSPSSIDQETVLAEMFDFLRRYGRDAALRWDPTN